MAVGSCSFNLDQEPPRSIHLSRGWSRRQQSGSSLSVRAVSYPCCARTGCSPAGKGKVEQRRLRQRQRAKPCCLTGRSARHWREPAPYRTEASNPQEPLAPERLHLRGWQTQRSQSPTAHGRHHRAGGDSPAASPGAGHSGRFTTFQSYRFTGTSSAVSDASRHHVRTGAEGSGPRRHTEPTDPCPPAGTRHEAPPLPAINGRSGSSPRPEAPPLPAVNGRFGPSPQPEAPPLAAGQSGSAAAAREQDSHNPPRRAAGPPRPCPPSRDPRGGLSRALPAGGGESRRGRGWGLRLGGRGTVGGQCPASPGAAVAGGGVRSPRADRMATGSRGWPSRTARRRPREAAGRRPPVSLCGCARGTLCRRPGTGGSGGGRSPGEQDPS